MDLNLQERSKEFIRFYNAFAFKTHGISMGIAAERAAVALKTLSKEEQQIVIEWFLELFKKQRGYYANAYLQVVEYSKDIRFLPYLQNYYKELKKRNRKLIYKG